MEEKSELTCVYSGTALTVNLLKNELEVEGIFGFIQNDFQSGISAGFAAGSPSSIDLFIQEADLKKAEPIVKKFREING